MHDKGHWLCKSTRASIITLHLVRRNCIYGHGLQAYPRVNSTIINSLFILASGDNLSTLSKSFTYINWRDRQRGFPHDSFEDLLRSISMTTPPHFLSRLFLAVVGAQGWSLVPLPKQLPSTTKEVIFYFPMWINLDLIV